MCDFPDWLPDLILLDDHENDWDTYLDAVHKVFQADFGQGDVSFKGNPVRIRKRPIVRRREPTFWHIVQEGKIEDERTPDFRRLERMGWPKRIIEEAASRQLPCWHTQRGTNSRSLIALSDFSYLVVLDRRPDHSLLWTAYPIEFERRRKQLRDEYDSSPKC